MTDETIDDEERRCEAEAPERIFLNICDERDCTDAFSKHEVTWTAETAALDIAVEYVRADSARAEKETLDALEDMWWQHCVQCERNESWRWPMLSSDEWATAVLQQAGRVMQVRPDKEWYRLTTPEERAKEPEETK